MAANTNNHQQTQPQDRPIALQQISHWLLSVIGLTLGKMRANLHSWWQKIKQHPVATILVFVGSALGIALIVVVVLGYWLNWHWTGLVPETSEPKQHAKTLWDWLQLLIIPAVLAVAALLFNFANSRTEQQIAAQRYKQDQQIAAQRYKQDQQIALDKQRQDLLEAYLDRMSELLLKEKLRSSEVDAEVRNVARVRTITVLTQLDARRIGYVFAFLREAGLMSATSNDNVVSLSRADLHAVNWRQADLSGADLSGANLSRAELDGVNLSNANLSGANFDWADLSHAILSGTNLSEVNLNFADLTSANLKDAIGVTVEELEEQANSLRGATMPDGAKQPWT